MTVRTFAALVGIAYLVAAMLGFVPMFLEPPPAAAPPLKITAYHGLLLGVFPVNFMHNLAHLAIGAWGVAASRSARGASAFAKALAVIYGILAVMGLMPETHTVFGLVPLYGYDVWLHGATALLAAVFGWLVPASDRNKASSAPA